MWSSPLAPVAGQIEMGPLSLWLLFEGVHYLYYRWSHALSRDRSAVPVRRPALLEWDRVQRAHVPDLPYHETLETRSLPYCTGARSVYRPQFRPLLYHGAVRLLYYTGAVVAVALGWRREWYRGRVIWSRGISADDEVILFCHGFGFGIFPYFRFLHRLSQTHHVIAPEYPGICHDGRVACSVPAHSTILEEYLGARPCHVLSNSFGSFVHQALLQRGRVTVRSQVYTEPVCFYPYFGRLFDFIEIRGGDILRRGLSLLGAAAREVVGYRGGDGEEAAATAASPSLSPRQWLLQLLSYIAVISDPNVLRLCQELLLEPWWDAERHITTIPTQVVLSAEDHIIESHRLQRYFRRYSTVESVVLPGRQHGDALITGVVTGALARCMVVPPTATVDGSAPARGRPTTRLQLKFPDLTGNGADHPDPVARTTCTTLPSRVDLAGATAE